MRPRLGSRLLVNSAAGQNEKCIRGHDSSRHVYCVLHRKVLTPSVVL